MTNKKIAFISHKTRGQEIIKILEGMGGKNRFNLDGSKGVIAIDVNGFVPTISNDWDARALLMNGWKYDSEEEALTVIAECMDRRSPYDNMTILKFYTHKKK